VAAGLPESLAEFRVGFSKELCNLPELDSEVRDKVMAAIDQLKDAGTKVVEVDVPSTRAAYAAWWTITFAEGYAYHESSLQENSEAFGDATRQTLLTGALLSAADYVQAQRMRSLVMTQCAELFGEIDVLVTPCTANTAPVQEDWDHFETPSFTSLWSLVGYPALSLCCGFAANGLPVGMQIVGRPFEESLLLAIGRVYQRISDWHTSVPALFGREGRNGEQ
jgi:aspartyl-tRNA(Asn)/glutamyl-tRNA(Gln) amidotransferase subunit A